MIAFSVIFNKFYKYIDQNHMYITKLKEVLIVINIDCTVISFRLLLTLL